MKTDKNFIKMADPYFDPNNQKSLKFGEYEWPVKVIPESNPKSYLELQAEAFSREIERILDKRLADCGIERLGLHGAIIGGVIVDRWTKEQVNAELTGYNYSNGQTDYYFKDRFLFAVNWKEMSYVEGGFNYELNRILNKYNAKLNRLKIQLFKRIDKRFSYESKT